MWAIATPKRWTVTATSDPSGIVQPAGSIGKRVADDQAQELRLLVEASCGVPLPGVVGLQPDVLAGTQPCR